MRTAEEIIREYCGVYSHSGNSIVDTDLENVVKAINEGKKEAIEECAKKASVMYKTSPITERDYPIVNEESILSLIKELK